MRGWGLARREEALAGVVGGERASDVGGCAQPFFPKGTRLRCLYVPAWRFLRVSESSPNRATACSSTMWFRRGDRFQGGQKKLAVRESCCILSYDRYVIQRLHYGGPHRDPPCRGRLQPLLKGSGCPCPSLDAVLGLVRFFTVIMDASMDPNVANTSNNWVDPLKTWQLGSSPSHAALPEFLVGWPTWQYLVAVLLGVVTYDQGNWENSSYRGAKSSSHRFQSCTLSEKDPSPDPRSRFPSWAPSSRLSTPSSTDTSRSGRADL